MFLVDTSVWLAHTFTRHPAHRAALSALSGATSQQPVVICRATEQSFLRLATTPAVHKLYSVILTNDDALVILDALMAKSNVVFRAEPEGITPLWHKMAQQKSASPKVWMDAYLAAFAIVAGLTIVTLDADFRRYESAGLKLSLLSSP